MSEPVSVRAAVEEDAAALLALRSLLFSETEFMLWEPGEFRDTAADEAARIKRLNAGRNSVLFVAQAEEGALVGYVSAFGNTVRRQQHSTTLALGVRQSHWRHGVGSQLLQEALKWSMVAGVVRVELTVQCTNSRAVALYERLGFEREGVRRKSLFVNGEYVDEYLMSRLNAA